MIIIIDGFWGSGKSVLRSLLDAHPELYVSPSQEAIFSSFHRNQKIESLLKYKNLHIIRKFLFDSYYYDLENNYYKDYFQSDFIIKTRFDFYNFEKLWTSKIQKLKKWDSKKIIEIIHSCIIKTYYKTQYFKAIKSKKVFMEDNNFTSHEFYLKKFPDLKLIITERDISGIITSLIKRKVDKKIYHSDQFEIENNFNYMIYKKFFLFKDIENRKMTAKLIKKYPNRVYICNFDRLVLKTDDEMKKVAKFLNIKFNKILTISTSFGKQIKTRERKLYTGKIIHSEEKTLSINERKLLNFPKKIDIFNLITFLKFLYLLINYKTYQMLRFIKNKMFL
jgi:hypothetical protein